MKYKLTFLTLFLGLICCKQKVNYGKERIQIVADKSIDTNKLYISLNEGIWKTIIYPLFENNKVLENTFPEKTGEYNLLIKYADSLYYSVKVNYKENPKNDKLKFKFYSANNRIWCEIKSNEVAELNKVISLNAFDKETKKVLKEINEK